MEIEKEQLSVAEEECFIATAFLSHGRFHTFLYALGDLEDKLRCITVL